MTGLAHADNTIAGKHGLPVVERQSGSKRQRPAPTVVLCRRPFDHLWRYFGIGVHAIQRVKDGERVDAHGEVGKPVRIEHGMSASLMKRSTEFFSARTIEGRQIPAAEAARNWRRFMASSPENPRRRSTPSSA
jgi:hypothetical protein